MYFMHKKRTALFLSLSLSSLLALSHQQKLDLGGSEVAGVDLDQHVLGVTLDVSELLHTLAHPRDFRAHVLEGLAAPVGGQATQTTTKQDTLSGSKGYKHETEMSLRGTGATGSGLLSLSYICTSFGRRRRARDTGHGDRDGAGAGAKTKTS